MVLLTAGLLAFTAMVIIPFVWMILMSLRTTGEILNNPYGWPTVFRWQNYLRLFFDPGIRFYRFYYNSLFVTFFALLSHRFPIHAGRLWLWPAALQFQAFAAGCLRCCCSACCCRRKSCISRNSP